MRLMSALICVALAGCSGTAEDPPVANPLPSALDDSCGAARYAGVIGQDAFVLQRGFKPGDIRIIQPGTVASQEYIPTRLSFLIGANNTIRQISCG